MTQRAFFGGFSLLVVLGAVTLFFIQNKGEAPRPFLNEPKGEVGALALAQIEKSFSSPQPLTYTPLQQERPASLTKARVIYWTNAYRKERGLLPLSENETLNSVAAVRLADMFGNQYFDHVSPTGAATELIIEETGYEYAAIGENLALGVFTGDQGVVDAWMGSDGHRSNILNVQYSDIGVAVGSGNFKGERVWIAVQIFGRPLATCPYPDEKLKREATQGATQLAMLEKSLADLRIEIDAAERKRDARELADGYNALVGVYDNLFFSTQPLVDRYNDQVKTFNTCLAATP